eukprot:GHVU01010961.1.p1 GENE.GHVU01010961.1~~GHVU01010961.1.p1  ORF type:complete len:111 (+),score=10.84 GHVU01010961.1:25-333(+)
MMNEATHHTSSSLSCSSSSSCSTFIGRSVEPCTALHHICAWRLSGASVGTQSLAPPLWSPPHTPSITPSHTLLSGHPPHCSYCSSEQEHSVDDETVKLTRIR